MKTYDDARTGASLRARELRRNSTPAEQLLWRALREQLSSCKWRRQMPVGPYFADFACFAERLIVELDGGQHAEMAASDPVRTRFLQSQGFRVLRFWNNDVLSNTAGVLETIAAALTTSPPQPAAGPLPLPGPHESSTFVGTPMGEGMIGAD